MLNKIYASIAQRLSGSTDAKRRRVVIGIGLGVVFLLAIILVVMAPPPKEKPKPAAPTESTVLKAPVRANDLEELTRKFNADKQARLGEQLQRTQAEEALKKTLEAMSARVAALTDKPTGATDEQIEKLIRSRVDNKIDQMTNAGQFPGTRVGTTPPTPSLGAALPGAGGSSGATVPLLPSGDGSGGAAPYDAAATAKPKRSLRSSAEGSPAQTTTGGPAAVSTTGSRSGGAAIAGAAAEPNFAARPGTPGATLATNVVRANATIAGLPANASTRDVVEVAVAASSRQKDDGVYLPMGSIISGVTLTGIDAPTSQAGQKNPVPMLIRIKHDAILPNRFSADVRECFLIASGYGSLSSQRAKLRTNAISCVRNDGKVVEATVSGYLVGDDGREGIDGRLVSKTGDMIRNTLIAGFMQAGAQRLGGSATNIVGGALTGGAAGAGAAGIGDLLSGGAESGALGGAGQAINSIGKLYADMAKEAQPVVEVLPGRSVTIVLTAGLSLRIGGAVASINTNRTQ